MYEVNRAVVVKMAGWQYAQKPSWPRRVFHTVDFGGGGGGNGVHTVFTATSGHRRRPSPSHPPSRPRCVLAAIIEIARETASTPPRCEDTANSTPAMAPERMLAPAFFWPLPILGLGLGLCLGLCLGFGSVAGADAGAEVSAAGAGGLGVVVVGAGAGATPAGASRRMNAVEKDPRGRRRGKASMVLLLLLLLLLFTDKEHQIPQQQSQCRFAASSVFGNMHRRGIALAATMLKHNQKERHKRSYVFVPSPGSALASLRHAPIPSNCFQRSARERRTSR